MNFRIEFEQEEDGRWIAEIVELPGVMVYGRNPRRSRDRCIALTER